jgi:hypothetical protein
MITIKQMYKCDNVYKKAIKHTNPRNTQNVGPFAIPKRLEVQVFPTIAYYNILRFYSNQTDMWQ